jgi:hypothetical protein
LIFQQDSQKNAFSVSCPGTVLQIKQTSNFLAPL